VSSHAIHIYIYDYNLAICALSPSSDSSYLAYPSPVPSPSSVTRHPTAATPSSASPQPQSGDVILFSTRTLTLANVIRAHKAPISFLALNSAGTLLATASDKGTVIRVWSVPGAEKLYQFRRGTREARIYSINFNAVSTLLAVSSAHDTVHIFRLGSQEKSSKNSAERGVAVKGGSPASPAGSLDSREGPLGVEGGYEAFIDGKKKNGCIFTGHIYPSPTD
jgi:autophagy-related protein 18